MTTIETKVKPGTKGSLEDFYRVDPLKACRKALQLTRNAPWRDRMERIGRMLGTYGTEAIRGEWQSGFWCDIVAKYCNTGDTYELTIIHVRGGLLKQSGRFIISSMGDFVEKNSSKYGIN